MFQSKGYIQKVLSDCDKKSYAKLQSLNSNLSENKLAFQN